MNKHTLGLRILAATALAGWLGGCEKSPVPTYQGYVEGEYLYLSAPQAGYLKSLDATRGNRVVAGQALVAIATDSDAQALAEAEARAESAREKVENLKEPRRPPEIAALRVSGTTLKMYVVPASLEVAFIYLMQGSQDLFKG